MTALITTLCLTLGVAIAAASFIYGRQIGYTKRDAETATQERTKLDEQLKQAVEYIEQLEQQLRVDAQPITQPAEKQTGWEAFDRR